VFSRLLEHERTPVADGATAYLSLFTFIHWRPSGGERLDVILARVPSAVSAASWSF